MLRITVISEPELLTFRLEGKLAGPWVQELAQCWQTTLASQGKPGLRLDLTGVTFVDAAGKQFLAALHLEGAEFVVSGCSMRAMVAEITRAQVSARLTGDEDETKQNGERT
jgi:anti-anti-sigma regulatory factor